MTGGTEFGANVVVLTIKSTIRFDTCRTGAFGITFLWRDCVVSEPSCVLAWQQMGLLTLFLVLRGLGDLMSAFFLKFCGR